MSFKPRLAPEVRISELEAELQAKCSELKSSKERVKSLEDSRSKLERQLRMTSSQYSSELEARISALEAENQRLKPLQTLQFENERLQLELEHAVQLRAAFELKFKEAKVSLLSLEQERGENTHETLLRENETLQRENDSLRRELRAKQIDGGGDRVRSLEKELYTLKNCYDKLYQETRQEAMAYAQPETDDATETPRVTYQTPPSLLPDPRPLLRSKPRSESQSSPVSQLSSSKISAVSTASYCPSFLRSKKPGPRLVPQKKPCSRFLRLDTQRETFEESDMLSR